MPLATGGRRRYVNLDAAASTLAMRSVLEAVERALPWYSSVHRGAGFPSQVSTRLYEAARQTVAPFVGARDTDAVIFVRNTTDAVNHLAHALRIPDGAVVLTTAVEHHANMLPWRRIAPVVTLPPPPSPEALLESVAAALRDPARRVAMVAVTGASNVTGEIMPVAELATLAHEHGAMIAVDAAQPPPTGASTWRRGGSTASASAAARCTRPSAPARWSRPPRCSRDASLCSPAAARSTS